ncbi:ATP-binding protein [Sulfuritalea sp.]|uniref:ATP-binding protein n=1 Tax=Sulfuritalea sp. TaxID=2480090 RepID=UPI00286DBF04|nr:ATP-binding protein [Sulfuritalea sp.]
MNTWENMAPNRRILLIDDMPSIHEDFRKVLGNPARAAELDEVEAALFGGGTQAVAAGFELDSAYQGQEGLAKVCQSLAAGQPYAMAFVDMRMPPGWDGIETIEQLWQQDPQLQIVICTAYADYSWDEILRRLAVGDRLLILKKPFDAIEVFQLANALTAKRQLTQQAALKMADLEAAVHERTEGIQSANNALTAEIMERKQLESRLVQSEKLASIGQLAAGVAHEINNPVGFVLSNVSTLNDYVEDLLNMISAYEGAEASIGSADVVAALKSLRVRLELDHLREDIPSLMKETREGLVRVRQIVQDLRDFSRVDSHQDWQWADLHRGIDATLNIVGNDVKYQADIIKEYGAIPEIECLPSQLNQVIMNLVINAAQAIGKERGKITIRTGVAGDQVWIEVADTGSGIAKENLSRIFDPFFTTKPVGKGTGLGLSVSYGIVHKHLGRIEAQSEVGKGTIFRIVLPVRHPG